MTSVFSRNTKRLLIPVTLLAVALLAAYWAMTTEPFATELGRPRDFGSRFPLPPDERRYPGDLELYYTIRTVVTTVNATLASMLLIAYIDIYRRIKSEFTIGLGLFSVVLLLYALVSNPLLHSVFGFWAVGLGPFAMLPDLFACIALSLLLYLSLRY